MPPFRLSHVALVVVSLEATRARLERLSPAFADVEDQPSERVRELYVGLDSSASLLLCQPVDDQGPYARALAKRGPGLHHIGVSVPSTEDYAAGLLAAGAKVCLRSDGQVWLSRPGFHTLIEACEMPETDAAPFVTGVEIPLRGGSEAILPALGLPHRPLQGVTASPDGQAWLTIAGERFPASALAGP